MTDALRAIAHAPMLRPSPLWQYQDRERRRAEHDGALFFSAGEQGAAFNVVFVHDVAPPPAALLALADAFFAGDGGYSVLIESEAGRAMETELRARSWVLEEDEPALVLPRMPSAFPSPPAELEIRRVATRDGLRDFYAVTEMPPMRITSPGFVRDPDVGLFVGYVDGQPAASSRLYCYGDIAELTGIVTVPAFRRRGVGTAMTWAAIAAGAARGCTAVTLTATEMGYPVYLRMGFVPVCRLRVYAPPA